MKKLFQAIDCILTIPNIETELKLKEYLREAASSLEEISLDCINKELEIAVRVNKQNIDTLIEHLSLLGN
ncbi:MAG: hypothetical protein SFU25_05120 [Candidatus Caenarcaniphilales bacterium]|nr:hypothetical protein [Candidatus Caenarcaniphilales bacterium]